MIYPHFFSIWKIKIVTAFFSIEKLRISFLKKNRLIFSPPFDQEFVNNLKNSLSPLKVIIDAENEESMRESSFEELLPFEISLLSQELSYQSDLFIYSERVEMCIWKDLLMEKVRITAISTWPFHQLITRTVWRQGDSWRSTSVLPNNTVVSPEPSPFILF